jgi:hypothetical protein
MNLSPALQRAIEQIAASQGISTDEFIVQTLTEKVSTLHQQFTDSKDILTVSSHQQTPQLQNKNGILVIETAPLDHINFNNLIEQLRAERDQEQMCL